MEDCGESDARGLVLNKKRDSPRVEGRLQLNTTCSRRYLRLGEAAALRPYPWPLERVKFWVAWAVTSCCIVIDDDEDYDSADEGYVTAFKLNFSPAF